MRTTRLFLLIALCTAPSVIAQEYRIQMQRQARVGQQFEVSCRLQETRRATATLPGKSTPEYKTNFVAALDGLIEILEVDARGQVTRASCTISNCLRVEDEDKRELLPRQVIVVASAEKGNVHFRVNGKEVDAAARKIIAEGMQLNAGGTSKEEVFGTDVPKKVGESWNINTEFLARELRRQNLEITDPAIEGRTTLEQLTKVGEVDCLELASKVYLKKFMPPVPTGVQVKQAFGALRLSGKFPLDVSLASLEEALELDWSFIVQDSASGVTTRTASTRKRTLSRKYLK